MVKKIIDTDNVIGRNIRKLRTERHITQTQLVRLLQLEGIDIIREVLVKIESGRQNVKLEQLRAIKKIFGVTWEELLDEPEQEPKQDQEQEP